MDSPTPRLDALKKHLRGVRQRLLGVFLAFGLGTSLTAYYHTTVIGWLIAPAHGRLSPTGLPTFTGISEVFEFTVKLALVGGAITAAPVVAVNLFQLVSLLPYRNVRRFLLIFLPTVLACYLIGVAFFYFIVLPLVLTYMLRFGDGVATPMIGLSEYMDLVTALLLYGGLVFEIPPIMFLLSKFRIVSYERMKSLQWPPYVPVAAIFLAAIITSTLEFTIPIAIVALYEVGLLAAWVARPKQAKPR